FTNSDSYLVNFIGNATVATNIVNALGTGTGVQTLNIGQGGGPFTYTVNNAFLIATNDANTMTVAVTNGTLAVTNSSGTAQLVVGQVGTATLNVNGGTVQADLLLVTNFVGGQKSTLTLTSGTLI